MGELHAAVQVPPVTRPCRLAADYMPRITSVRLVLRVLGCRSTPAILHNLLVLSRVYFCTKEKEKKNSLGISKHGKSLEII